MDSQIGVNLHHILNSLVVKANISENDAALFLKELISILSEKIINEEAIDIDSLGAFSVNDKVNDEQIKYYLSFNPDNKLVEQVNKPFINFETTKLNEGVELDNIEVVDNSQYEDHSSSTILCTVSLEAKGNEMEEESEVVIENEIIIDNVINEEQQPVDEVETQIDVSIQDRTPSDDMTNDIDTDVEDFSDDDIDDLNVLGCSEVEHKDLSTDIASKPTKKSRVKRKKAIVLVLASAVVILASTAFFLQKKVSSESAIIGIIGGVDNASTDIYMTEVLETVENVSSAPIDSVEIVSDTLKEISKPKVKATVKPEIVTLSMGKTLRLIALEKLGHREFWVYIYLDNKSKISNPNNVPVGVELIIPAKEKYGIDASSASSIRRATEKGREVMSKF